MRRFDCGSAGIAARSFFVMLSCVACLRASESRQDPIRTDQVQQDSGHDDLVRQLVAQLGANRFIERQVATETLTSMGLSVMGPVREAMQSTDPEVRSRARQIMRIIRHDDRQRLINAFIAGVDVDAEAELPGWSDFQQIAGPADHARDVYVEMLQEEWVFLDSAFHADGERASSLLTSRILGLESAARRKRSVSVGSVAALLLVASRDDVQLSDRANLMSLCYRSPDFDAAIRSGATRESLRCLMGKLIGKGSGSPYLTQRFHFALYYDLKEGLAPARQVVKERLGIPHVRQYAVLVLAKLGDENDLELVRQMLDDTGIVSTHNRVNSVRITAQVRDIALASLIMRAGAKPEAYGLGDLRPNSTFLIQTSTVGFPNDQDREQAILKWISDEKRDAEAPSIADVPEANSADPAQDSSEVTVDEP